MLSARGRACGGKVGAGTVEAEEDICVGKVHLWVGSVGLFCCLRGQIARIDKQEMDQPYVCFLSSRLGWRDVCTDFAVLIVIWRGDGARRMTRDRFCMGGCVL